MKMNLITRILVFALFGMIVGGAFVQSAPELPEVVAKFFPVVCAVGFQYLHFVKVPFGVFSFVVPTTLKGAREQRGALAKRMNDLIALMETEKRSFTPDEKKNYDDWNKEFDQVQEHFLILEKHEQRNLLLAASMAPADTTTQEGLTDKEKRDFSKFSLVRGLQLLASGKALDGIEAEVHAIAEREARDQGLKISGFAVPAFLPSAKRSAQSVTGTTSVAGDQGGFTVQTEVNALIEGLWANNFLGIVGSTRFAGLVGNQTFPVQSTNPAAEAQTENGTLSDQLITFGHVDMAPKRRGATIPISKQLLMQSSFDVQSFVIAQIQKALDKYLSIDAKDALLAAITSGNANLIALGTNGAAPTWDDVINLETILAAADADKGSIKTLTNPKVRGKLKRTVKLANTIADPIWEKDNTVNGYQAITSTIIPSTLTKGSASAICSAIILGNFADLYTGMWGGVDFIVDPFTGAKSGLVQITANMFWDVEVARAASFVGIKDALTT